MLFYIPIKIIAHFYFPQFLLFYYFIFDLSFFVLFWSYLDIAFLISTCLCLAHILCLSFARRKDWSPRKFHISYSQTKVISFTYGKEIFISHDAYLYILCLIHIYYHANHSIGLPGFLMKGSKYYPCAYTFQYLDLYIKT